MTTDTNEVFPYAASACAGLVVCFAIAIATGRNEAWDSAVYFVVGIPVMCLMIFLVAYRFPTRPWRWTLSMAIGQSLAMVLAGSSLSLWPLAVVGMLIVSLPQFAAGFIASRLSTKRSLS